MSGTASTAAVNCGSIQPWDSDGDSVPDNIEINNTTAGFRQFDPQGCDTDTSVAVGRPSQGAITDGINLTDRSDGYLHVRGGDPVDFDDWGTLSTVTCVQAVGRRWAPSGIRMNVNDMSRRRGGRFVPHSSHQNGLDIDIRYVRTDGANAPLDIRQSPDAYDPVTTAALIKMFLEECRVSVIFADVNNLGFTNDDLGASVLMFARGHSNHFHVRLKGRQP